MNQRRKKIIQYNSVGSWLKKQKQTKEFKEGYDEMRILLQIATLREQKSLTQRQLAAKIGMKQSQLARIETGNQNVTIETLSRIASVFGKRIELV